MNKLIITATEAHFKIPMRSKIQNTYKIPPISTVVGILKNIYGQNIDDFEVGYFIEFDSINKEVNTIYKEINLNADKKPKGRFIADTIYVENLINPRLVIYHSIKSDIEFNQPLCLGKANYLANIKFDKVELIDKGGIGYNQYTPTNIGSGMINRINTITEYNDIKGYYEYKTTLVRENLTEFELNSNYDETEDMNIYMWKWRNGDVS